MPIINFPKNPTNVPPFFSDVKEDGYHIYSLKNAKKPNFYPPELPDYPGVPLKDLKEDDVITIRVFFLVGDDECLQIKSELVEMEVVFVEHDSVVLEVMTELSDEAPLEKYDSLELYEEDILYKIN